MIVTITLLGLAMVALLVYCLCGAAGKKAPKQENKHGHFIGI
jgi:hypothetical protein